MVGVEFFFRMAVASPQVGPTQTKTGAWRKKNERPGHPSVAACVFFCALFTKKIRDHPIANDPEKPNQWEEGFFKEVRRQNGRFFGDNPRGEFAVWPCARR
nr:hypothetical protein [Pandoravirus belohorizontensis]